MQDNLPGEQREENISEATHISLRVLFSSSYNDENQVIMLLLTVILLFLRWNRIIYVRLDKIRRLRLYIGRD